MKNEYETLKTEHNTVKNEYVSLEGEHKSVQEKCISLENELKSTADLLNQYKSTINSLEQSSDGSVDLDLIKEIILRVWRINNRAELYNDAKSTRMAERMIKVNDDFSEEEREYLLKTIKDLAKPIKFIAKQCTSILDTLNKNGFEIKDHTNTKYHDTMALKVLVFETVEGIEESIITETIKPSIYYNNKLILNGEVIVSNPPET